MNSTNLETYFRNTIQNGCIDHALRATVGNDGVISFYIHPYGKDGDTLDYVVSGDTLIPKDIVDSFKEAAAMAPKIPDDIRRKMDEDFGKNICHQ